MDPRLRLILDPPRDAAENMARDEALLDGDGAVIRRTAWRRPAATLGRFQRHSELPSEGVLLPAIRRITGGGTILHGADCTLAIAAPAPSRLFPRRSPRGLAERAAEALLRALEAFNGEIRLRGGEWDERREHRQPDCFLRRSPFDLVQPASGGPFKVAGLALHRRGGRVLVQASVARDGARLEEERDGELLTALARALGAKDYAPGRYTPGEESAARDLEARRYGTREWNRRV